MTTLALNAMIERMKENKTACRICDTVLMITLASAPIAVPFIIMYLAINQY